ncbi:MAG: glutathione S-transferase family protein [Candidatus Azotimanducaceae bacterium]
MKLHESPSPNARRVTVFMAEKGIECEKVSVDIRGGENIQSEYLRKNPAGRVPVLELDDGSFISESMAICRYLEAIQPEPNLFGTSAIEIANVEMWQRRVELNLFSEIAGAFRNITGFFKDRETCVEEWGRVCAEKAPKALSMFDNQLSINEYLAGERFTVADITLAITLDFAEMVKVAPLPTLDNISRWREGVVARASLAAN